MEIDDFPLHWEATLMGKEFWKDIDEFEKERDRLRELGGSQPSPPPQFESSTPPPSPRHRRFSHIQAFFSTTPISNREKKTDKNEDSTSTLDTNLHKRFPFNLEPELGSITKESNNNNHPSEGILPKNPDTSPPSLSARFKHRRKFSMSDIKELQALNLKMTVSAAKARLLELSQGLSPGSPTPTGSQTPWTPTYERKLEMKSPSMFISSPKAASLSSRQTAIEGKELPATPTRLPPPKFDIEDLIAKAERTSIAPRTPGHGIGPDINTESPTSPKAAEASGRPLLTEQQRAELRYSPASFDIATFAKPLMSFRGREAWDEIPTQKPTLGLDLFWPQSDDDDKEGFNCLSIRELEPIFDFRRLRSLKLTGMLQSYQSVIWKVVWLNPELQELELGMALEPEIVNKIYHNRWKVIDDTWTMDQKMGGSTSYFGENGSGELHSHIGHGEYLDKQAIEKAKIAASAIAKNIKRKLTIRKLTLNGFVVDADPFIQWFDPETLRGIHFKDHCVDAGFWLPLPLKKVVVRSPKGIDLRGVPLGIVKIDMMKDLKVVEIHKGVDTRVMSYQEHLDEEKAKASNNKQGNTMKAKALNPFDVNSPEAEAPDPFKAKKTDTSKRKKVSAAEARKINSLLAQKKLAAKYKEVTEAAKKNDTSENNKPDTSEKKDDTSEN